MMHGHGLTTSQFVTAPKLDALVNRIGDVFDYQSVCHCSKTKGRDRLIIFRLTTSQFVTAPKPASVKTWETKGLTTSQFVTAPKLEWCRVHCGCKFDYQSV